MSHARSTEGADMNKLQQLIEAANGATPGPWDTDRAEHDCPHQDIRVRAVGGAIERTVCTVWIDDACHDENGQQERNADFIAFANPATILELCALLEKAEAVMYEQRERAAKGLPTQWVAVDEALAAIKQWKEQT